MFKSLLFLISLILSVISTQATAQIKQNVVDGSQSSWFEISLPYDKLTHYFRVHRSESLKESSVEGVIFRGDKQNKVLTATD